MKLYRRVDDNGLFIEDILLDEIPYLTETISEVVMEEINVIEYDEFTEVITLDDDSTQEVMHTIPRQITKEVPKKISYEKIITESKVINEVYDESSGELIGSETIEVPIVDHRYIETPCPQGFYHPRWDGEEWVEGGSPIPISTEQQIENLKIELSATDYKIIKCSEYQLMDLPAPYDIAELHNIRQEIRDTINQLELEV